MGLQLALHGFVGAWRGRAPILITVAAVAVGTLFAAAPATAGTSLVGSPRCDAAAQTSGECLGWAGLAGTDPRVDAVTSALRLNEPAKAKRFFTLNRTAFSSTAQRLVTHALGLVDPRVAPSDDGVVSPDVSQVNNGATKATSYFSWVLHGSTSTQIFYGYCDSTGCPTLGSETADLEANTYFPSDGAHWYMDVTWNNGDQPHMTKNVEKIKQDRTAESDPTKSTLPCPTSGYALFCNVYSDPSMTSSNWYYFQADWTNNVSGYPADDYEVQTRRWKVLTSSNWQFLAYGNGG